MTDRPQGEDPGDRIGRLYDRVAAGLYRYALMILGGSVIVFVILLPFVAHSLWDYIEARRVKVALDAIQARGERLTQPYHVPQGDAARCERYYRAAAALASSFRPNPQGWFGRVIAAGRSGELPMDVTDEVRSILEDYGEALSLVDRAALLPFEGISSGFSYNLLNASLSDAVRLTGLRAILRTIEGDGNAALDSIYAGIRIQRAIENRYSLTFLGSDLDRVLERTTPSGDRLARVGAALSELELDGEDFLRRFFQNRLRSAVRSANSTTGIVRVGPQAWMPVLRPWVAHQLNEQIRLWERLIQAADAPWPQRIDNVIAIGRIDANPPRGFQRNENTQREVTTGSALSAARQIAMLRAYQIIVAVERYRRDHDEQLPRNPADLVPVYLPSLPIDPFSGEAMRLKSEMGGYVVYSVGSNRKDDGGNVIPGWPQLPQQDASATDTGVRIQHGVTALTGGRAR